MRASGGGRDEYPDHRPGRAAAGAAGKRRRPGPASLVIGSPPRALGLAARKPHRHSTAVRKPPGGGTTPSAARTAGSSQATESSAAKTGALTKASAGPQPI